VAGMSDNARACRRAVALAAAQVWLDAITAGVFSEGLGRLLIPVESLHVRVFPLLCRSPADCRAAVDAAQPCFGAGVHAGGRADLVHGTADCRHGAPEPLAGFTATGHRYWRTGSGRWRLGDALHRYAGYVIAGQGQLRPLADWLVHAAQPGGLLGGPGLAGTPPDQSLAIGQWRRIGGRGYRPHALQRHGGHPDAAIAAL